MWYIHTMEYYSAIKKGKPAIYTTWMDLESIMLHEIGQTEEEKYCMLSFICGIWKSHNHRNRKYNGDCQRQWGKRGDIGQRVQISSDKINKFWGSNL